MTTKTSHRQSPKNQEEYLNSGDDDLGSSRGRQSKISHSVDDPVSEQKSHDEINKSGVLLPNLAPKKKKKMNLKPETPTMNEISRSEKSPHSFISIDENEDWQEFKNYNKKCRGKSLKDRVELLGKEIEKKIDHKMEENLQEIKEIIHLTNRKQPRVFEIHVHQSGAKANEANFQSNDKENVNTNNYRTNSTQKEYSTYEKSGYNIKVNGIGSEDEELCNSDEKKSNKKIMPSTKNYESVSKAMNYESAFKSFENPLELEDTTRSKIKKNKHYRDEISICSDYQYQPSNLESNFTSIPKDESKSIEGGDVSQKKNARLSYFLDGAKEYYSKNNSISRINYEESYEERSRMTNKQKDPEDQERNTSSAFMNKTIPIKTNGEESMYSEIHQNGKMTVEKKIEWTENIENYDSNLKQLEELQISNIEKIRTLEDESKGSPDYFKDRMHEESMIRYSNPFLKAMNNENQHAKNHFEMQSKPYESLNRTPAKYRIDNESKLESNQKRSKREKFQEAFENKIVKSSSQILAEIVNSNPSRHPPSKLMSTKENFEYEKENCEHSTKRNNSGPYMTKTERKSNAHFDSITTFAGMPVSTERNIHQIYSNQNQKETNRSTSRFPLSNRSNYDGCNGEQYTSKRHQEPKCIYQDYNHAQEKSRVFAEEFECDLEDYSKEIQKNSDEYKSNNHSFQVDNFDSYNSNNSGNQFNMYFGYSNQNDRSKANVNNSKEDDASYEYFDAKHIKIPRYLNHNSKQDFHKYASNKRSDHSKHSSKYDSCSKDQIVEKEIVCVDLIKQSKYPEAIDFLLELKYMLPLSSKDPHSIYINYLMAECYSKLGDFAQAEEIASLTVDVTEDYQKDKYIFLYRYALINLLGYLSMKKKNYQNSFDHYKDILFMLESAPLKNPDVETERRNLLEDLHIVKYNMGNSLLEYGDVENAILIFKETLDLLAIKMDTISKRRIISCLKKLSKAYGKIDKIPEALHYLQNALNVSISDEELVQDKKTLISIYDNLGSLYGRRKLTRESISSYEASLELKIIVYGVQHQQTGFGYINIGKAYLGYRKYEEAFENFSSGNHILEETCGKYNIHSANSYVCMAQIKYKMKQYKQSSDLYSTALDIYVNLLGKSHVYTYRIYLNLLYLSFILKDNFKMSVYEKMLSALLEKNYDMNSFSIYNEIGNIFRKYKQYQKALNYYFAAVKLFKMMEESQRNYEELSLVYCNIASTYILLKEYSESINYYKIALKSLEGEESQQERCRQIRNNIKKVNKILNEKDEIISFLDRAEDICRVIKQK